ncbi:formamidopyrimidine-DNA glycosylase [Grosmannia clavigera kw1407]|uniref:Formamidopyrimidine-DNA glycosylase n=1 Tax=Grosmannia clavigera (strain kw1407 / UAMH 11150) TaxID=655863 RepID=F0XMD2_GROCL|nr:formamidopyrimidine-DNA glycosylase [Grosmannia clavigera kw1407]EFX01148.1 formamidopyrimidine-DNA glycosylase [Grosmannia clavigera kw1407]
MPEIAEAARIVHFLRKHLVGKQIKKAAAIDDSNVFGKAGTTGATFAASVLGKKVLSAGSQGKYFWIVLDSQPHPVMHFGMTGWIHIKGMRTAYTNYYNKMKPGDADLWPPRFWKFHLQAEADGAADKVELAFTDPRRFGRVRLIDCPGDRIRQFSPLVENGPDPVVDADIFTESFVRDTMQRRHVPIKALLLDQAFISGIGNWVGDEVLFQARLHPEQYCDEFDGAQVKQLYTSICHVCRTAVDLLGDSDRFPDDWLFHYRWGKGSKGAVPQLPGGEKLSFLTVGGRTSCFAPSLQKKSGGVAPGIKEEPVVIKGDGVERTKTKQAKETKQAKQAKQEIEMQSALPNAKLPLNPGRRRSARLTGN